MQKVAFFDIDGTVFRSSLLIKLVEAFVEQGVFPELAKKGYQPQYEAWTNREGTYEDYIEAVIRVFLKNIKGVHYGTFADIGNEIVEREGKKTYRYTRDLIQDLKSKDYYIVAISHSPKTILDKFCESYGFDKVYGKFYEIGPRDLLTGKAGDDDIQNKAMIVERVFEQQGFSRENSIGVGDTEGDIPLLESVEMPICFNPNMRLYTYAKEKKWPVIVERKDVVYTI